MTEEQIKEYEEKAKELDIDKRLRTKQNKFYMYMFWGFFLLAIIYFAISNNTDIFGYQSESAQMIIFVSMFAIASVFALLQKNNKEIDMTDLSNSAVYTKKHLVNEMKNSYSETLVIDTLNTILTDVKLYPDKGVSKDFVKELRLIDLSGIYTSKNLMLAKYEGIDIMRVDVNTHFGDKLNGEPDYSFKGQIFGFSFNKEFKSNIRIIENNYRFKSKESGKHLIKLEDEEFNNKFEVIAKNTQEAYYILTPHFMEKMKNLVDLDFDKEDTMTFFFDLNRLYIAVNNEKDSFEYEDLEGLSEEDFKDLVRKEIKRITHIIDELSLDNDLFK